MATSTITTSDPREFANHRLGTAVSAVNRVVQNRLLTPYQTWIARTTARVLTVWGYDVVVNGPELRSRHFAITIANGCDGIEVSLLLAAAILSVPAHPSRKLAGLIAGFGAIAALNLVRVLSLWRLGEQGDKSFDLAHFTLWPALLMAVAWLVFVVWLHLLRAGATGRRTSTGDR